MPQHNLQLAHKIKVSFLIPPLVFLSMPNFSASHYRISTISTILIASDQALAIPLTPSAPQKGGGAAPLLRVGKNGLMVKVSFVNCWK